MLAACAAGVAGFGARWLVLIRGDVSLVDKLAGHVTRLDSIMLAVEAMRGAAPRFKSCDSEAAAGTASVVESMAEVWQGASATGSAAGQVLSAATAIGHRTVELRAEAGGFLGKMRAA